MTNVITTEGEKFLVRAVLTDEHADPDEEMAYLTLTGERLPIPRKYINREVATVCEECGTAIGTSWAPNGATVTCSHCNSEVSWE